MTGLSRICSRLWRRLVDNRGDSLVEALVAILIAALGALALATMVTASMNEAVTSERALAQTYQSESVMEQTGSASSATITFSGSWTDVEVKEYRSADGMFTRYADENETAAG